MRSTKLGPLDDVSNLTLGGGGIGQGWGMTSREEAVATLRMAIDRGINLLDTAPLYRNCEAIVGEAFDGRLPDGLKVTTKCGLGTCPPEEVAQRLRRSLENSLEAMKLEHIDLFFLHSYIASNDFVFAHGHDQRDGFSTRWSLYTDQVVPTFERMKRDGLIGAWGITGIGVPKDILAALALKPQPQAVQAISNLMDSPGSLRRYADAPRPRDIIRTAHALGIGVMGIRVVQAGALTAAMDRVVSPTHPDGRDFARAATFRTLCDTWGEDPARIAYRYALSIEGVDTLVLGVKNRAELQDAFDAEAAGPLEPAQVDAIDALALYVR